MEKNKHLNRSFLSWMGKNDRNLKEDFLEDKSEEYVEFCYEKYIEFQKL